MKVKSEREVAQSYLTLSDPMDGSLPDSSVHGIFQAKVLEWGAITFSVALTRWTFVGKVMSLLFNTLTRFVIAFIPRSKHLLISWLQSPSTVILEPRKIKSATVSIFFPSVCPDGEGNGNPLQYSCLENPMDGGAWWATVHGVAKSRTLLNNFTFTFRYSAK